MDEQSPEPIIPLDIERCLKVIRQLIEGWDAARIKALTGADRARFRRAVEVATMGIVEAHSVLDPGGVARLLPQLMTLSPVDRERLARLQPEAGGLDPEPQRRA
jgi:hypothetical protein